jgi:hypothetical protein
MVIQLMTTVLKWQRMKGRAAEFRYSCIKLQALQGGTGWGLHKRTKPDFGTDNQVTSASMSQFALVNVLCITP